jgi:hypothetical protein
MKCKTATILYAAAAAIQNGKLKHCRQSQNLSLRGHKNHISFNGKSTQYL